TRSKRDWSSDVCSSDLAGGDGRVGRVVVAAASHRGPGEPHLSRRVDGERSPARALGNDAGQFSLLAGELEDAVLVHVDAAGGRRSEERRVGEGGRGWGA